MIFHGFGNDKRRKSFTEAHYIIECSGCSFFHQIDAVQNVLELIHLDLYLRKDAALFMDTDQFSNGVKVAFLQQIRFLPVQLIPIQGQPADFDEFIRDTAESGEDYCYLALQVRPDDLYH